MNARKVNLLIVISAFGIFITSCSQSKFVVAPQFTDVEKISKIETGQSLDDVNEKLGIKPYDVLYLNDGGYMCYYNYRLLDRKINIDNSTKNRNNGSGATLSSELSQKTGEPFYSEWRRIYINFQDGKLTDYVTDAGLEDANYIQLVNSTIRLLSKEDLQMENFYNQNCCPGSSINLGTDGQGQSGGNNQAETKVLNLEKLLFQLKYNGKFKESDTPRKKKGGLLNVSLSSKKKWKKRR
jgi:hypothetical protein